MHSGVPGRVLAITDDGLAATVDSYGMSVVVRLDLVEQRVVPGDYVLNDGRYAISKIPDTDVAATLALHERLLRDASDLENEELEMVAGG